MLNYVLEKCENVPVTILSFFSERRNIPPDPLEIGPLTHFGCITFHLLVMDLILKCTQKADDLHNTKQLSKHVNSLPIYTLASFMLAELVFLSSVIICLYSVKKMWKETHFL